MDVRIGVTYSPKELEVELGDEADPDKLKAEIDAALGGQRRPLAHRPAGPPGGRAGRQGRLRRDRQPRRRPPHRVRRLTDAAGSPRPDVAATRSTCSTASCSSSPARVASARPPSPPALALLAARRGKRTLVCEVDAKGNLADFFEAGPTGFEPTRGPAQPVRHVDGHRGVAQGVPEPPAEDPAGRPHRPAGPHASTSSPTPPRGSRRSSPSASSCWEVREQHYDLVVVDAVGHRPRRRPSSSAPQAIDELVQGRPGPRPDGLDARHPRRPGHDRGGHRGRARGDAGQRDPRAGRAHPHRDPRRPRRRRGQPGAARAVRPGRGGGVRRPARARRRRPPSRRPPAARWPRPRRRRAGGHPAPHPQRAPRPPPRRACRACRCSTCPYLFTRSHGIRATSQLADALAAELGY